MKTAIKNFLFVTSLISSIILSSCGKPKEAETMDAYVEMCNNEATRDAIRQFGIFTDYSCARNDYNIVFSYYFNSDYDLSLLTDEDVAGSKSEIINSLADDYLKNKVAFDAIETMKNNRGDFIYVYYDTNGIKRELKFAASEIINSLNE